MFRIRRAPRPVAKPTDRAAIVAGLRAFADDLEAGDDYAVDCISPGGEMPLDHEWADYPAVRSNAA